MELTKLASIHLYLLGFDDDLTNFNLTMNNPSTQAEQLEIDNLQKKISAVRDAVSDPGNGLPVMSQSRALKQIMKWSDKEIKDAVADAGYKTPAIAKLLMDNGITPLFPYKRPMTKDGFFKKDEYVYDEYFDCYICPGNHVLRYSTTNRDGYKEYKSSKYICAKCPYLSQCTESKEHIKVVTRHIWEEYMEECEDIRHTLGMKELYKLRKETIERLFGTAKENHGFRYTQMYGKARMVMKVGLTYACLNLKKLARMLQRKGIIGPVFNRFSGLLAAA